VPESKFAFAETIRRPLTMADLLPGTRGDTTEGRTAARYATDAPEAAGGRPGVGSGSS